MQKSLIRHLLLIALIFGALQPTPWAADDGQNPVVVDETSNHEVQEVLVDLAVAEAEVEHEHIVIRTKRGTEFEFSLEPQNAEERDLYRSFSPEFKTKFQENRISFLTKAATVLDRAELLLGSGNLIKNKLVTFYRKIRYRNNPIAELSQKMSLRQGGVQLIDKILRLIDHEIWRQAPASARKNEEPKVFSINIIAMAGVGELCTGGICGLEFVWGNSSVTGEKVFVFEVNGVFEPLERAIVPTAILGFIPKFGRKNRYNDTTLDPMRTRKGRVFYPPVAPLYLFSSPEATVTGAQTLWFALPSVFNSGMSFVTKSYTKPLYRRTHSSSGVRCSRLFSRHK